MGERTHRAVTLMANHCSHGSVEVPGGTSMLGQMIGLPIGMVQVRCEHAQSPTVSAMDGLALAVEFYRDNCAGCTFRNPNGQLPTLATESDRLAGLEQEAQDAADAAHQARIAAWEQRRRARKTAVAIEGYAARDIAQQLDTLDIHPDEPAATATTARADADRNLREIARRAPELFNSALVDVLFVDATTTGEPTAIAVLAELATHGHAHPGKVAALAAQLLANDPSPPAGEAFAALAGELDTAAAEPALGNIIRLSAPRSVSIVHTLPGHPGALHAAAQICLPQLTDAVLAMLLSENDSDRASAAHAARHLLEADIDRIDVLGPALVSSIIGNEQHYAGYPHPDSDATKALAASWTKDPARTRTIVEREAPNLDPDAKEALYGISHQIQRSIPQDATDTDNRVHPEMDAVTAAFLASRVNGDWGSGIALSATRDLTRLTRRSPGVVLEHRHTFTSALLNVIGGNPGPTTTSPIAETVPGVGQPDHFAQALSTFSDSFTRAYRRDALGELIGALGASAPRPCSPTSWPSCTPTPVTSTKTRNSPRRCSAPSERWSPPPRSPLSSPSYTPRCCPTSLPSEPSRSKCGKPAHE
jgi:hypothetical protein